MGRLSAIKFYMTLFEANLAYFHIRIHIRQSALLTKLQIDFFFVFMIIKKNNNSTLV